MRIFNYIFISILLLLTVSCSKSELDFANQAEMLNEMGWQKVDTILTRIIEPKFNSTIYIVNKYYNKNDGRKTFVNAVNNAIKECNENGGGIVIIPKGEYISNGSIYMLSNVNLHLEEGANVKFGVNPDDYTPLVLVRWEGTMCYNYSPLIYAYQQENIAVTGNGVIDGQTQLGWYKWKKGNDGKNQKKEKDILRKLGNDVTNVVTRVFGNGYLDLDNDLKDDGFGDGNKHYLRPTSIEFLECKNILLENITIRNTPFWNVHPVFCSNVTIRGLNIEKGTTNDDGIDPDSCNDVLIENCTVNTNDDAIAVKAGRDQDAWERLPAENIIIRNNNLTSGVNGFCIGSEMSGSVRNVFVYNNKIPKALRGINFKCNLDRGGVVENIFIRDIEIDTCTAELFIFRMDYQGYRGNNFPTKFNNFFVSNINCGFIGGTPFKIVGVKEQHIQRVYLSNFNISAAEKENDIQFADEIILDKITYN